MKMNSRIRNFTLVEMLTVIAIIGILAAITVGTFSYAKNQMAVSRTQTTIAKMNTVLRSLQAKFGFVPQTKMDGLSKNGSEILVICSAKGVTVDNMKPEDVDLGNKKYPSEYLKVFIDLVEFEDLKKICISFDDKIVVGDAWGQPILYRAPGYENLGSFDLFSAGRDGYLGDAAKKNKLLNDDKNKVVNSGIDQVDTEEGDDIANF